MLGMLYSPFCGPDKTWTQDVGESKLSGKAAQHDQRMAVANACSDTLQECL